MTDSDIMYAATPDPSDICPASRDADQPTGFQLAVGTLGIPFSHHQMLVDRPEFGHGWDVGVENSMDVDDAPTMPLGTNLDDAVGRQAWLVGFIAGQYSRFTDNSSTPFCITEHAENECPGNIPATSEV